MKNSGKVLMIAGILILAGAVLAGIGFACGGIGALQAYGIEINKTAHVIEKSIPSDSVFGSKRGEDDPVEELRNASNISEDAHPAQKTEYYEERLSELDISAISDDVELTVSADDRCTIRYTEDDYLYYEISLRNGELTVIQRSTVTPFTLDSALLRREPLQIALPPAQYRELTLETVSGDLSVSGCCFGEAELSTTSGDIRLSGGRIGEADFETVSGDVYLTDYETADTDVETVSGNVCAELRSPKQINSSTISGDVRLPKNAPAAKGSFAAETISGDIIISVPD